MKKKSFVAVLCLVSFSGCPEVEKVTPAVCPSGSGVVSLKHHSPLVLGCALQSSYLSEQEFSNRVVTHFGILTTENEFKWDFIHPESSGFYWQNTDRIVEFAQHHGLQVKGHCLVWHRQNPSWILSLPQAMLADAMASHIKSIVGRYKGKIQFWDVVNEPFDDEGKLRDQDTLGDGDGTVAEGPIWSKAYPDPMDFMVAAFLEAHKADRLAKLILNDYGIELGGPKSNAVLEALEHIASATLIPKSQLGIGIQCHFHMDKISGQWALRTGSDEGKGVEVDMDEMMENLSRYSASGFLVMVSELDIPLPHGKVHDEDALCAQGQTYHMIIQRLKNVESIAAISFWGLTDKYTWKRGRAPLLWDENYVEKAAFWGVLEGLE